MEGIAAHFCGPDPPNSPFQGPFACPDPPRTTLGTLSGSIEGRFGCPGPPKPSKAYVLLRFCIHFMKSKFPQQVGPETSKRPQSDTQTAPRDPKGGPWAPFGGPGPTLVLFGVPPGLQRTV